MLTARVIAEPARLEASLDQATAALARRGWAVAVAELLEHDGAVLQIGLPGGEAVAVREVLSQSFAPCDVLVAAGPIELPQLMVSDMDSTIIGQECIDELGDYAGLKPQIAAITERAMQGELDFEAALRERVALLAGLEEDAIATCLAERIRPTAGARELVQTLKANGCRTVLVTGGFHHFADAVADQLGFDRVVANRLAVMDGRLTGQLVGRIIDSSAKAAVLVEERGQLGADSVVLGLGDGANDAPMLKEADYGVAYHAKPAAQKVANGAIDRGDLTSVVQLLGLSPTNMPT